MSTNHTVSQAKTETSVLGGKTIELSRIFYISFNTSHDIQFNIASRVCVRLNTNWVGVGIKITGIKNTAIKNTDSTMGLMIWT